MRPLVIAVGAVALIAGCTSSDDRTGSSASPATAVQSTGVPATAAPATATPITEGTQFEVGPLGLAFRLPESFVATDDADYAFFARSISPHSLFTIDDDSSDVTDHDGEPGESLSELDLGNIDALVVTDAVVEGMPAGVSSNELLVSNGEQSFSVIMSAATADRPERVVGRVHRLRCRHARRLRLS